MEPIGRMTRPATVARAAVPAPRGGGFVLTAAAETAALPATGALGLLLAAQESGAEAPADRQAQRRARTLLAELTALQRDLLAEGVGEERLDRLAALATQAAAETAATPSLHETVQAIVLRARVELARFGRA